MNSAYLLPGAIIALGAIVGGAIAMSSRGGTIGDVAGRRDDLEKAKADVVAALRALELEREKLPPATYAADREALLARGAEALRALDGHPGTSTSTTTTQTTAPDQEPSVTTPRPAADPATARATLEALRPTLGDEAVDAAIAKLGDAPAGAPPAGAAPTPNTPAPIAKRTVSPAWMGAAYAFGLAAVIGILYVSVSGDAMTRGPNDSITGTMPMGGAANPEASGRQGMGGGGMGGGGMGGGGMGAPGVAQPPQVTAWTEAVAANNDDLVAHNGLTEWFISAEDLGGAMAHNSEAIRIDENDPDAQTYHAYLLMAIGRTDDALGALAAIQAEHPDHVKSAVYLGLLSLSAERAEQAIAPLEKAIALGANESEFLQERLAVARAVAAGAPMPPAPPSRGPNMGGGPAAPAGQGNAGGGGGAIVAQGHIELGAAATSSLTGAEIVFVTVMNAGGGPPLAAVRMPASGFPMDFTITTDNAIAMGGTPRPFPPQFNVKVRIDSDGNAGTRPETDPTATLTGITMGATDLVLAL